MTTALSVERANMSTVFHDVRRRRRAIGYLSSCGAHTRREQPLHPYSAVLGGATGEEWETAPDSQVICSLPNLLQEIVKKFYTQLQ